MATISTRLGIPIPVGTDAVTLANRQAELQAIEDNAAALGLTDQAVNKVKAATLEVDGRTTTLAYDGANGNLLTVTEKDGATTIKTTTLHYTGGAVDYVDETAGGVTRRQTLGFTGNQLTAVTKGAGV